MIRLRAPAALSHTHGGSASEKHIARRLPQVAPGKINGGNKLSNVSYCGEACYADDKCMAASIGKFSDYAIKYECYLYELGYKVHDANGWNSYFKLIDGALPPSTPATVYREHYVVRQAGVLRAYSPGEAVPESHAAAWAITGIVLTCVAFFAVCCGVARPRKNDISRMAQYGYDPQEVG